MYNGYCKRANSIIIGPCHHMWFIDLFYDLWSTITIIFQKRSLVLSGHRSIITPYSTPKEKFKPISTSKNHAFSTVILSLTKHCLMYWKSRKELINNAWKWIIRRMILTSMKPLPEALGTEQENLRHWISSCSTVVSVVSINS